MYLMSGLLAKKFEVEEGLMSIRQIFNVIHDDQLPIKIDSFYIFLQIGYLHSEAGEVDINLELVDKDWKQIKETVSYEVTLDSDEDIYHYHPRTHTLVLETKDFSIDQAGFYDISVSVNSTCIGSIPFTAEIRETEG